MTDYDECESEFIDGCWYGCEECDDCNEREAADSEEWRPGECDHCYGETVSTPFGEVHCACAIGQGASPDECRCGPEDEPEATK